MERLHARVQVAWVLGALLGALVLGGIAAAVDWLVVPIDPRLGPAVVVLLATLGAIHAVLRYRVWRFDIREDALYIERGVITRVRTVAPFVRVQHVDTQRGPVERLLGLASVVVYTAGSRGADVTIPGLTPERADDLRERLRRLAIESEHEDAV